VYMLNIFKMLAIQMRQRRIIIIVIIVIY